MKTQIIGLALIGILGMSASCKSKKAANDDSKKTTEVKDDTKKVQEVQIVENIDHKGWDPIEIEKATVEGDILKLKVNYSGGCEEHKIELHATKMYKKSLPPQLSVFLAHDANGDACRKLEMRELMFNIEEIAYPGGGELILLISDGKSDPVRVSYTKAK